MVTKRVVNVIDLGADPSGRSDCTNVFREALEDATASVLVPMGIYRISGMLRGATEEAEEPAPPTVTDSVTVEVTEPEED